MLGMVTVRGLVVGLVDSGSLLHWDRARMLAKRSVEKKKAVQNTFAATLLRSSPITALAACRRVQPSPPNAAP